MHLPSWRFRGVFGWPVLLLVMGLLFAPVSPARADALTDGAQAFTETMISDGLKSLTVPNLDDAERIRRLRGFMQHYADMPGVAHFVLGRYWDRATAAQQSEFVSLFGDYLIQAYVGNLQGYSSDQIKILGATSEDHTTAAVHTRIDEPGEAPTRLDILLHVGDDGSYQVNDLVVDGVSIAIAKKSEFAALLRQNGGAVEKLLSILRDKLANLRSEAGK